MVIKKRQTTRSKNTPSKCQPNVPLPAQSPTPKPRARQQCRKCRDGPPHYRNECPVHSQLGKGKALEQQAQANIERPASSPQAPPPPFQPSVPPPQTWDPPETPTRPSGVPSSASKYLLQRAGGMSSPLGIGSSPLRFQHDAHGATSLVTPTNVIDPALLDNDATGPRRDSSSPEPGELQLVDEITPTRTSKSRKKIIPGEFGYVANVRDGLQPYKIPRRHQAPQVSPNRDLATRNFKRRVTTIIESCEDVAINTGACIFFGAYHPTQKSDKIWMYTSPKLIAKANDFANTTTKSFYNTMRSLADSKRLEVQQLQDRIDAEQARAEEAEARAALNEDNYQRVRAQLEALQSLS